MKLFQWGALAGSVAMLALGTAARADTVNFDEFTSPPVTCCFSNTGITGPLTYDHIVVRDGDLSGFVMNGSGWANQQTSGDNLFGTLSGSMDFLFVGGDANNVSFDLINGLFQQFTFTVSYFGGFGDLLDTAFVTLNEYSTPGSVDRVISGLSGVRSIHIDGNGDFAVDTISFGFGDVAAVPEPATWALMIGGFGLVGASLRRRRALAA